MRKDFYGADIRQEYCLPYQRVVESGKCPTLNEVFATKEVIE